MKKNTWNIRWLVDEPFVPSAQQTSVLYCRLTDFKCSFRIRFLRLFWNHFYNFSRSTCFLRIDIMVDQRDRTRRALLQHKNFDILAGLAALHKVWAYLGPRGLTPGAIAQFLQAFCTNLKDILTLICGE